MDQLEHHHRNHSSPHGNDNVGGVNVYPTPITLGEHINIVYEGLLFTSGAQEVYVRLGFGNHDNWHDMKEIKMLRTGRGWEQTLQVNDPSRINFCFKDNAENWDNNYGHNWSYEVHHGKTY